MTTPFDILEHKRDGAALTEAEIASVVAGAATGSWTDSQLSAFLMAAYIHGLDAEETRSLTLGMLRSGEQWGLANEIDGLGDKHSTGGVGDKTSLILTPILAAAGVPVAMLTGRGLAHTGGTTDKLESIPGLDLELDRSRCVDLLGRVGMAIGMATAEIAPADRRLYGLRDHTATVPSLPLITASILSKKLATGASGIVFDVKTGNGAFMQSEESALQLAGLLVDTCEALGQRSSALITDMNQPLGRWVGHSCEVLETLDCLAARGADDLMTVVYELAVEVARLTGEERTRGDLERVVKDGTAHELFLRWAAAQGAEADWLNSLALPLAPVEYVLEAPRAGYLAAVATRRLGLLLAEAGAGRTRPDASIDLGVALRCECRLSQRVDSGQELARVYLRREDEAMRDRLRSCFEIGEAESAPPKLIRRVVTPSLS